MKLLFKSLAVTLILSLFIGSFIFGPPLLNESNVYKQFWTEFLIAGFSIVCILELWTKKSFKFSFNLLDAVIVLLLCNYILVVLYYNPNSLIRNPPIFYALIYFISKLALSNLKSSDLIFCKRFFFLIIPLVVLAHLGIVYLQLSGLSNILNRHSPYGSTFGNPDMLGAYLVTLLPFCLMQERSMKTIGYIACLLSLSTLLILQARSAIVAIYICGIVWIIVNKILKLRTIIIISVFSCILLFLLIIWHPDSVFGRFFVWFTSLKMIFVKPFGWGLNAFEKYYPEFQAGYVSSQESLPTILSPEVVHSPFNELLNIGVSTGIPGLMLYTLLLGLLFYHMKRLNDRLLYPILAFFIISLFYFPFKISPLVCLVIPLVAVASFRIKTRLQKELTGSFMKLIYMILLVLSLLLAIESVNNYNNYRRWQMAYSLSSKEDSILESEKLFSELYPDLLTNGRFLISYSDVKLLTGNYQDALHLLEEAKYYYCDITISLKLAKLYEKEGHYEKARKMYDLAINLAPRQMVATYEKILFLQKIEENAEAYNASIELLNRPISASSYADPYIIRNRLRRLVLDYERTNTK